MSAGRPVLATEVRIVDGDGKDVPVGEVGQILGRGPQLMQGYHNRPDATAEALADGWMHTGDAGYLDAEGFLYVSDRVKDMIISGGENIYPREIEDVLFQLSAVADAAAGRHRPHITRAPQPASLPHRTTRERPLPGTR